MEKGDYDFIGIEKKWQRHWETNKIFRADDGDKVCEKPKYYVLDMFPYPSGAGLHVGHPEGYTASDIVARYKRMKGFNVLHPIGWDAFGLPAEQYAVQTGTHPAEITQKNIDNMRSQIKSLGFSYDWDRQIDTTDVNYYKWTQWIFLKLFNSWFDEARQKARPIEELPIPDGLTEEGKRIYIDSHRLAYESFAPVNWCPELGTVLANEEVIGGVSERGSHPVIRRPMRQWMLRITKYCQRLLDGLDQVDWTESIKKLQCDWIGKSVGAEVDFKVDGHNIKPIRVFTTRPDTLFGATYMVLAPEHNHVDMITTDEYIEAVEDYKFKALNKSDLDRTDLAKDKTGQFTGAWATNPVNGEKIPIWISDYVLISYGTGAIMAVPAHDERDYEFATRFNLSIRPVVKPPFGWLDASKTFFEEIERLLSNEEIDRYTNLFSYLNGLSSDLTDDEAYDLFVDFYVNHYDCFDGCFTGDGTAVNSGQFTGLSTAEFKTAITEWLAEQGLGKKAVNFKLRDWLFSRQRYWGEPFPIIHTEDGRVVALSQDDLPLVLPPVDDYKPTGTGAPPLAKVADWLNVTMPDGTKGKRETNTMPQWAGSCWYYLRYMDPDNADEAFASAKEKYWMPVDLYIGGAEHAVLHLLYSRFWHKLLYDLGYVSTQEPFKKLINQGMILGLSYRDQRGVLVANDMVRLQDGKFVHKDTGQELEEFPAKMSKSLRNVVNPDDVIAQYGADSMRLYEMFMGPLEATKPWNTHGVEGVYRFLGKVWRAVIDQQTGNLSSQVREAKADEETDRLLHRTIKKVGEDVETFGFNTAISQMMIFVNHLGRLEVRPRSVVEKFVLILAPFAPHIAEELWQMLGHADTLAYEPWPCYDQGLVKEKEIELAVQVLGKIKDRIVVAADATEEQIKEKALANEKVSAAIAGRQIKKMIVIKSRLVNIIV